MKEKRENLNPRIKEMINNHIKEIENQLNNIKGSYDLFLKIKTRYQAIDKSFSDDIISYGKIGPLEDADFSNELKQMKEKLIMYLELDMIPIKYVNNIATGVNITANKITNKGIIGNNAVQTTNKSTEINTVFSTEKKGCWLSKLFKK